MTGRKLSGGEGRTYAAAILFRGLYDTNTDEGQLVDAELEMELFWKC